MAKLKMKKIEILACIDDVKNIVDYIQRQEILELSDCPDNEHLEKLSTQQSFAFYDKYLSATEDALKTINKYSPESKGLLASFFPEMKSISTSEYNKLADKANEYLGICFDINSAAKEIEDCASAKVRCQAMLNTLEPWLGLDVPMKYKGTKSTSAFIGTLPADYDSNSLKEALLPALGEEARYECEVVSSSKTKSNIFVICHNDCKDRVFDALRGLGFSFPSDPTKHPPQVRYDRYKAEIEKLDERTLKATETIKENAKFRNEIEFAYDYFSIYKEKYSSLFKLGVTGNVFVLNGFIAEKNVNQFTDNLKNRFTVAVNITDPDENDDVPVELENNSFAGAVEGITKMYSLPGKNDIDPNPVMSFFYYALFGIMLSDAGYGLLMVIGTAIAKAKFKLEGSKKKLVDMYFYCGIATVFWGALFGSWFGDIVPRVAQQFFGISNLGQVLNSALGFTLFREAAINPANPGSIALWFEPVNDPTKLLLFSFLFGIIHLFFGVGASFVKMWKLNNKVGAFCDCIPVFLTIIGIAPIGANIIKSGCFNESVTSVSKWLALAGAVLIVLTSGRDSKNIIGKLGLGLYGLYNAASGWLSDILSYSRLLALGLCTGVIATVINILGTIPESKGAKLGLLIPVFIFGHIVNMAINLIGTYVHTNRLQYVEFFAKFYEGGGRAFTPLKTNTKYYKIKEEK